MYWDMRVCDWDLGKKPLKASSQKALADLTWGQLHQAGYIQFKQNTSARPYKRALCLIARVFLQHANMEQWQLPRDVDPTADEFSYMSNDERAQDTIRWLHTVAAS